MKISPVCVAVLWIAGLLPSARAAERDVRHAFNVQPGCTLKIDTYRGMITVTESDEPVVQVSIHMEVGGDTAAEAERVLAGLKLDVKAQDNTVSIFARNPRETKARWAWREDEQIGLFYRITVPRACNVEVKNVTGDLTVGRLAGKMVARVDTGTVFFRGVEGSIDATLGEGDLVVSRCSGDVAIGVRQGTIRTGTIGGNATLKNASGSIEVMLVKAAVHAEATAGDITVGFARELPANSTLTTSGGNIFARIDPRTNCRIEASASWGSVHCDLPIAEAAKMGKRKLHGRLNQGGALLALRASGGNIRIEAGEPAFE